MLLLEFKLCVCIDEGVGWWMDQGVVCDGLCVYIVHGHTVSPETRGYSHTHVTAVCVRNCAVCRITL